MSVEERLSRIEALLIISSKDVFDIDEAAMFLGLSKSRLYHLTKDREIPHYKKGKCVFFSKSELQEWMLSSKVLTTEELQNSARVTFKTK